jgi:acrylyl-CoA reductase (NADPH)
MQDVADFEALVARKDEAGFRVGVERLTDADLPAGDVTIAVAWSGLNYKDGLACHENGQVVRSYPMVPGIDLAGTVVASSDTRFQPGDDVLATSFDLGVQHWGGFAARARVPADWVVPLPAGLSVRESMILGTAGLTAAMALARLEQHGLRPGRGPVLVTGASGGVGSAAVAILAKAGYEVAASTGKPEAAAYLQELGAAEIIDRAEMAEAPDRPLDKQRWAGVVDSVGGTTLARALTQVRQGGAAAAIGLAGGAALPTSVHPFILRGVSLLGIDSAWWPAAERPALWQRLATDWRPAQLEAMVDREVGLADVPEQAARILAGGVRGRVLVRTGG